MPKDSLEQIQSNSTEHELIAAVPLVAGGVVSTAEPVVEIMTEHDKQENCANEIGKETEPSKIAEAVDSTTSTKKVRKTTQPGKGRKTTSTETITANQNGETPKTTTSRSRKTNRTTKATPTLVLSNEEVATPPATTQNEERAEPASTTQNGTVKKKPATKTSRTRKKSPAIESTATPIIPEEDAAREAPITPSEEVTNPLLTTQDLVTASDIQQTPANQASQPTKDVAPDAAPDKAINEASTSDDVPQEPTIIAEPIGAGATLDVVTPDDNPPAPPSDEEPQEQSLQFVQAPSLDTSNDPIEEAQQEEHTTSAVAKVTEEQPQAEEPTISEAQNTENQRSSDRRELVKSASLVSIGNFGSSVLGLLRQTFIAATGPHVSGPFFAAISPAQKFNDFVVNGSVPGALIPTFNDYAAPEKHEELRRLVFTLVNLIFLIMAGSSIIFFFIAPWFVNSIAHFTDPADQQLTIHFAPIIFLSLLALGPFAVLQSALFARKEFGWPAFATGAYHVGIIIGATLTSIIGSRFAGAHYGIAFGVILGAIGEIGLLLPGLYKQRLSYMFVLDLKQPAIRRILKLYGPIAFSFFVTTIVAFIDQSLATQTPCMDVMRHTKGCGAANLSAMQFSTTLIQFPGGLVASALSFAVLPTLTTHIREGDTERFKRTLLLGFRLGLLLMIPAAAGLIILQLPIISVIFEHRDFSPAQSVITATALQNYAYQLPFIAIDQLLISAFYARKNTIIPVSVGVVSVFGYLAIALPFWQTLGMPALVFANTVQNSLHAIILLVIMRIVIGPMHLSKLVPTLAKLLLATAAMVAVAWVLQLLLAPILSPLPSFIAHLITVIVVGAIAATIYFAIVIILKVEEVTMLKGAIMAKIGKK